MPRNTNLIPADWFERRNDPHWVFLRMDWPSPVGTLRWTTAPGETTNRDVGDGDGTQPWDGLHGDFEIGQFPNGDQNAGAVSDVTFANADKGFTALLNQFDHGCEGVPIQIWWVFYYDYDPNMIPHYLDWDRLRVFRGQMDRPECSRSKSGVTVRVSLKAGRVPLSYKFPRRRYTEAFGFAWLGTVPENLTIDFGIAGKQTLQNPRVDSAPPTTGGGGGDPGDIGGNDPGARQTPILADPGPRHPIVRGGGRDPRTVNR